MEETTNRIDSETELVKFLQQLQMANIEIPSNVTLEIESNALETAITNIFFNVHKMDSNEVESVKINRFTYMGERITFKSEQEQKIIDMMRGDEESGIYKTE